MSDAGRNRLIAGVMCGLTLAAILMAGLWPFGHPRNEVAWLDDPHGVRFGKRATMLSSKPLPQPDSRTCTVEMWVRPAEREVESTLLAFYTSKGEGFSIQQSWGSIRLGTRPKARMFHVHGAFEKGRPILISIVSRPTGFDAFLNGVPAVLEPVEEFEPAEYPCSGNFVVGDAPRDNDSWMGEFRGIAIFRRELTPSQVAANYKSWTEAGRTDEVASGRPDILYLFDERSGDVVHDRGTSGADLEIPKRYEVMQQVLLEFPWNAFNASTGYLEDLLINICGFVPFGFAVAAFLSASGGGNKSIWAGVLVGFLVSLTIETIQTWLPTRDSDLTDVMTNTVGTWVGVMLYQKWLPPALRLFSWMRIPRQPSES
jgi:VanZ family protein